MIRLLMFALSACMFCGCAPPPAPPMAFRGTAIVPPMTLPAQSFTDQTGSPFSLAADSTVTVLAFGYANCTTMCPTVLASMHGTAAQLGDDGSRVRFGFVTIDPERDDEQALQARLEQFGAGFFGLRYGPEGDQLLQQLGVGVERQEATDDGTYDYDHSGSLFLLDAQGLYRVHHAFGAKPEDVAHDLRLLLTP